MMGGSGADSGQKRRLSLSKRLRASAGSTPGGLRYCCRPCFTCIVYRDLPARQQAAYTTPFDVSGSRTYTFMVHNTGPHHAAVQAELGPDGESWGSFGEAPYIIEPGGKRLVVLNCFLRYVRFKYRSLRPGLDTLITIWFQGQS